MKEKNRKILAWVILVIAFAIMFFGGRFTGNGFAMLGFFLLVVAVLVRYGKSLIRWFKYGDSPRDESGEIIDIEPWLERPEANISITLFTKKDDSSSDEQEDFSDK